MNYYIRSIKETDAKDIWEMRSCPVVSRNILGSPAERLEQVETVLKNIPDNKIWLCAVKPEEGGTSEKVIGCVGIDIGQNMRKRHIGSLGIMVHKDFWDKGVGKSLMKEVLSLTDDYFMLHKIELEANADNEKAIHLYEKFGFEKEGVRRDSVIRDGTLIDGIYMGRIRQQ